jgi:hypothetical protein
MEKIHLRAAVGAAVAINIVKENSHDGKKFLTSCGWCCGHCTIYFVDDNSHDGKITYELRLVLLLLWSKFC